MSIPCITDRVTSRATVSPIARRYSAAATRESPSIAAAYSGSPSSILRFQRAAGFDGVTHLKTDSVERVIRGSMGNPYESLATTLVFAFGGLRYLQPDRNMHMHGAASNNRAQSTECLLESCQRLGWPKTLYIQHSRSFAFQLHGNQRWSLAPNGPIFIRSRLQIHGIEN